MDPCDYCDRRIGDCGVRRRGGLFCSRGCARRRFPPEFCTECQRETTSESTGRMSSVNGVGFTLMRVRGHKPCRECGSELARVWFTFGFPIIPLSLYRVHWVDEPWFFGEGGTWYARRLR